MFSAMAIKKVKNEIIDMIQAVSKRNNDRLKLPVIGTKYLRQVTDRATLQSRERMEQFVHEHELTSFETLKEYKLTNEQKLIETHRNSQKLTETHRNSKNLIETHRNSQKQKWPSKTKT